LSRTRAEQKNKPSPRPQLLTHPVAPFRVQVQDVHADGALRFYAYSAAIVNYGAVPQTWEVCKDLPVGEHKG